MPDYKVPGDVLTAFADEIRRLATVAGGLDYDMMLESLGNMESSKTLTVAENSTFGDVEVESEYGLLEVGSGNFSQTSASYGGEYKFIPNEDISCVGIRAKGVYLSSGTGAAGLWDESGNLLASCVISLKSGWSESYFDSPVNLLAGKEYIVSANTRYSMTVSMSNVTVNPKITFVASCSYTYSDGSVPHCETDVTGANALYGVADIIIAPPESPSPEMYSVQLDTMTEIANEVNRITGGTAKLSPEQIIAALQGVEAVTTTTE